MSRTFKTYERHGFLISRTAGADAPWRGWREDGASFRADTLQGAFAFARDLVKGTIMEKRNYRDLLDHEHEALEAFAKAHGRNRWRTQLGDVYWYNARIWSGPVPGMGNTLHAIRNEFGPTWLWDIYKPRK